MDSSTEHPSNDQAHSSKENRGSSKPKRVGGSVAFIQPRTRKAPQCVMKSLAILGPGSAYRTNRDIVETVRKRLTLANIDAKVDNHRSSPDSGKEDPVRTLNQKRAA